MRQDKKILFISDGLLQDKLGIGKVSATNLKCLKSIYGDKNVDVLVIESKEYLKNGKYEVIVPSINKRDKYISLFQGYYNFSKKLENLILDRIRKNNYNKIFIDNSTYGKLAEAIKKEFPKVEIIIFFHDVKAYLVKVWLKEKGFQFLKFYFPILKNEKLSIEYGDKWITLNKREDENLKKYYGVNSSGIIPISLEDNLKRYDININTNSTMLFVGSDYFPNYNGIKWFIRNVFPKLENMKLRIVGNGTEKWREEFKDKNIEVLGKVDDLGEIYCSSDFVVLPIFEGAGMKVKTAEALMYGKTVLGTRESFIGYDIDERMGYLCEDEADFINNIKKILKEDKIGFNSFSRELYEQKYSFDSVLKSYKKILKEEI